MKWDYFFVVEHKKKMFLYKKYSKVYPRWPVLKILIDLRCWLGQLFPLKIWMEGRKRERKKERKKERRAPVSGEHLVF